MVETVVALLMFINGEVTNVLNQKQKQKYTWARKVLEK
jgi:hypothetical protein